MSKKKNLIPKTIESFLKCEVSFQAEFTKCNNYRKILKMFDGP